MAPTTAADALASGQWTHMPWGQMAVDYAPVDPALARRVQRELGVLPNSVRVVADVPWLAELMLLISTRPHSHAAQHHLGLCVLISSRENACRYCYGIGRTTMRALGYSERAIDQLERRAELVDNPVDQALVDFVARLARSQPRPARAERDKLISLGLSPAAVDELALYTSVSAATNRLATMLAVPPEVRVERMVHGPFGWLMGRLLRSTLVSRRVDPQLAVAHEGPFAAHLAALGPSPAVQVLRPIVQGAISDGALSASIKYLIFLVVCDSLGCPHSSGDVVAALTAAGWSSEAVAQVRHHLDAPGLSARDRRLLTLARESVRYHTPVIQQLVRDLAADLPRAEVIEAVGACAVANAMVRMGMLLP